MKTNKITTITLITVLTLTVIGFICDMRSFFLTGNVINWNMYSSMFAFLTIVFSMMSIKKNNDKLMNE